jgi:hypothetical protein
MLKRSENRAEVGLCGETTHGIHCSINRIATCFNRRQHTGSRDTASVMGVEMNRQADFFFQGLDQRTRRVRATDTGHILDADNMHTGLFKFLGHGDVILQAVLAARWIKRVTGETNRTFAQCTGFTHGINRDAHVLDPVQ